MPRELLDAATEPDIVDVPARTVVAIDGKGEPGGNAFTRSLQAVYGAAYTLKFGRKGTGRPAFSIGPLEGRWWWDRPGPTPPAPKDWRWTLRIGVPRDVSATELRHAIDAANEKKKRKAGPDPDLGRVHIEKVRRQKVGRILHVGPYSAEPASLEAIARTAAARGRRCSGPHVEVYLSDPRRVAPSRLRTVLLRELAPSAPAS